MPIVSYCLASVIQDVNSVGLSPDRLIVCLFVCLLLPPLGGQVTTMLGLATPSAGKRAKEAAATAAAAAGGVSGGPASGSPAARGGGAKEDSPNEVFQRWCAKLWKALGKCFAARA